MKYITWSSIFGLFGFTYWRYGKKQENNMAYYGGIVLMIFPYFAHNIYIMIPIGIVLIILPFVVRR